MNQISAVQAYVNGIFEAMEDPQERRAAHIHLFSVAQHCALLAAKRGLDAELATAIGLLHDVYSYRTGVLNDLHGPNGAEMVRVAFKRELSGVFTEEEQILIRSALYHHSDKAHVHDAYDEVLKDADLMNHWLYDVSAFRWKSDRLLNLVNELGLPTPELIGMPPSRQPAFDAGRLADIAEALAAKNVVGDWQDADFLRIIRYFPEASAFDELKNAWCAAFVYHSCLEAGLTLPIRTVHTAGKVARCRLACVAAWYEWGIENGFFYAEGKGFQPRRGDIVIYHNVIPPEDKPAGGAPWDHIGILLGCDGESLTVAEGNVGNHNVSGIVPRRRDGTIGGYIRIPAQYRYEGWETDFKTGEIRTVEVHRR